jgi:crossover junction endodeoxyribonuclease RuvC
MEDPFKSCRILGIDPGSRATGYGVISLDKGRLGYVSCGVIRAAGKYSLADRLKIINDGINEVIQLHEPVVAAVEEVFMATNPQSALKLGHARGAAVLAAVQNGLKVYDYTAKKVKQSVVGYGQADKHQVQHMVRILLQLSASPSQDAADALAVAICHSNNMKIQEL